MPNEHRAKEIRRQAPALAPHVHCDSCGREVALSDVVAMGKSTPVVGNDGRVQLVSRPVPLCPNCARQIEQAKARPASRLIIPTTQVKQC